MNKGLRAGACIALLMLGLTGCTGAIGGNSEITPGPVGIGAGIDELKGTPCACTEIPMSFPMDMQV
jgi:hypothetical protein